MKSCVLLILSVSFLLTNSLFADDSKNGEAPIVIIEEPIVVVETPTNFEDTEVTAVSEDYEEGGLPFTPMLTCKHEGFDFDEVNYELEISTYMGVKVRDTISGDVLNYQTQWPIPSISKVVGTAFGDSGSIDVEEHLSYRFITAFVPYELGESDYEDIDKYNAWVSSFKFTFVEITENLNKEVEVSMIINDRPVIFSDCTSLILPSSIYPFPEN